MRNFMACVTACAAALSASSAMAEDLDARPSWYVQAASGQSGSRTLVAGGTLPWKNWSWGLGSGKVRGHWDVWLGGWSSKDDRNHRFTTPALGIGPSLRWRGAQGSAPWFFEAGVSAMVTGKRLYKNHERMGTAFNFASQLGVGVNFGARQAHELSVRVQHISNAGIKKPNPGLDSVLLRYAYVF